MATSGEIGRTNQFLYDEPSVLIGRKGTIDKPQYIDTPFWTIDTLFYTKVTSEYIPKFVFYLCQTIDWESLNEASGIPSLSANRIESFEVYVPQCMEDQLQIVKSLDAVEFHANSIQSLISKYEAIKKATVNLLLKPKPGDTRVKLGDVCELTKGQQLNRETLSASGQIPVYNGGISPSGYTSVANTNKDSVIISEGGNSCGYVNYVRVPFWRGGHCYLLDTKLEKSLLYYILKANESEIMALRVGTGLPNIQRERLKNFEFNLPTDNAEKRRIISSFTAVDAQISALQSLISKYNAIKQGMMSYFFG